ncbi:phytanoyl-CoA dioxygenase family protein [Chitinophaga polysaccharea]|uniref:phytanoyl-CoA dioxygenase family protein n=1 Tax=Chitinophaga polysaccharea TaxID=1293035 RepID=UPI0014554F13|nr:phytanoyl-CoA dioxygenase family protein [Chitinophaga polysaccharea]NLR59271.1 phytanoyl-CoA dioxygenase family protein [Chitinophaga polysaccharea]
MKIDASTLSFDLADHGGPVGDLFPQPVRAEDWEQYILSEAQVRAFQEDGYISGIPLLTGEQVDVLNTELERLQMPDEKEKALFFHYESNESEDPDKVLFHAIGGWRVTPGFHDLIWSPAYRMAAYQLLGAPFRLFHDQLFCKPAKHGGVVAWHQDFSYWTFTKPMHHLTCWIGLDDATTENGCLYYVPGSHRWGLLPITGLTGDMDAVRNVLSAEQVTVFDKKVANALPRGYASFHHPLMMHGSYANDSARPRRAIVLNAMSDGTLSNIENYERQEALRHFPPMPQDIALTSKHFPLLFEASGELASLLRAIPKVDAAALYPCKHNRVPLP